MRESGFLRRWTLTLDTARTLANRPAGNTMSLRSSLSRHRSTLTHHSEPSERREEARDVRR
jgi:hypothetical protein